MTTARPLLLFLAISALFLPTSTAASASEIDTLLSTFSGDVPQSCSFSNLSDTAELTYQGQTNSLYLNPELPFMVTSNASSIKLGVSAPTPVQEVGTGEYLPYLSGGIINNSTNRFLGAYNMRNAPRVYDAVPADPGVPKDFRYRFGVYTAQRDESNKYKLLPGTYVYQIVFTCYLD